MLFPILLLFAACSSSTQNNSTDSIATTSTTNVPIITTKHPISSNTIIEDKSGNIWFTSTKNGVYRFDGNVFTHFTSKNGLGHDDTYFLMEDQSGKIWCGTADGLSYFNGTSFSNISPAVIRNDSTYTKTTLGDYGVPIPHENGIWCMMQDREGIYWIGTMTGVYRYNDKAYSHFTITDSVTNNTKYSLGWTESILQDKDGSIWIGGRGDSGVFRFANGQLYNYEVDGPEWVRPLMQNKTGTIWFGSRFKFLFTYDSRQGEPSDSSFEYFNHREVDNWVFSMTEDNAGNFWIGNLHYDNVKFKKYTAAEGFCYDGFFSVMCDNAGNTWFTDHKNSLCRYDGKTFARYSEPTR